MKSLIEKTSDKLVNAFLKNKIIAPIPSKFCKKINEAQKLRKLCESKIKLPVIGFKAAGTGIPLINKAIEILDYSCTMVLANMYFKRGWFSIFLAAVYKNDSIGLALIIIIICMCVYVCIR